MPGAMFDNSFSAQLAELLHLSHDQLRKNEVFRYIISQDSELDRKQLLSSIPVASSPSHLPLEFLNSILRESKGHWPTFDLVRCQARLFKSLPEQAKSGRVPETNRLIEEVNQRCRQSYSSLGDFIESKNEPALRSTDRKHYISHDSLCRFVREFNLPNDSKTGRKPVVAVAFDNGPLLAASILATATYYTAFPVNPAAGPDQFKADILQARANIILTTAEHSQKLELDLPWVREAGIEIYTVIQNDAGDLKVASLTSAPLAGRSRKEIPNLQDDICIILFTSGTSGTKKVVPMTIHSVVCGVAFVIDSWGLESDDVCLNMMPLYHVGGLVRNIFAPVFSGGSTICCPAFDPNTFWDTIEEIGPTWYYASPSMHALILEEGSRRPDSLRMSRIRLICNAAGGLLPALALQLRDTFRCIVLPSYGMTECMPISTPPIDYNLDRPGTSGVSVGPEITILDWSEKVAELGTVGRICVRGEPLFHGYLKSDGQFDKSPFNKDGWFDTGDLGYLDEDGFLYITGRSKEVINRGGELISPFEVENAIVSEANEPTSHIAGRVSQALAFSVPHDVLQETVGVVLVTPLGSPRVDLRTLTEALGSKLQQAKWPTLIVYMDDVPKRNNKVLRIKLAERFSLPELSDDTHYVERHWEATCPPPDTDLSVEIPTFRCPLDDAMVFRKVSVSLPQGMESYVSRCRNTRKLSLFLAPKEVDERNASVAPDQEFSNRLRDHLKATVDNYMLPDQIRCFDEPLAKNRNNSVDEEGVLAQAEKLKAPLADPKSTMGRITKHFAEILGQDACDVDTEKDFFAMGGDSLRAGRLLSALRSEFKMSLPIDLIFNQGSVTALTTYIDANKPKTAAFDPRADSPTDSFSKTRMDGKTYSSTNPLVMILQLIPMFIVYPMRRGYQWTIFMLAMSTSQNWSLFEILWGRLLIVTLCVLFSRTVVKIVLPMVGIALKWIIIGRHQRGIYPMWGVYHTRWWLVQKITAVCGIGVFGATNWTRICYYRLMGAKIGNNVTIKGAQLGEWDLIEIKDGATLERSVCRPFAGEQNATMYLDNIIIGRNAVVGLASIVAAGTTVPDDACIGPNSSSWEIKDADEANRSLGKSKVPGPHWAAEVFLTAPIVLIGRFFSLIPWYFGLIGLVLVVPVNNASSVYTIIAWFTAPHRVGYHFLALILRTTFSPFFLFGFAVVLKWILDRMFGKLKPSSTLYRGNLEKWRASLIKTVLPVPALHDMTEMFGQHYEATSIAIRMLGGKVGKRVYWPGTGPSIGDYHLIDVGNDVVFGSRSHLITSDGSGSEMIKIGDNAMIADRVCLLPGTSVGAGAVLGSGALTRRGKAYANGSTWVGSKGGEAVCLRKGDESDATRTNSVEPRSDSVQTLVEQRHICDNCKKEFTVSEKTVISVSVEEDKIDPSTASPFGRAFYLNQAPYKVLGQLTIMAYSSFIVIFTAFYWNVPSVAGLQIVAKILEKHPIIGVNIMHDGFTLWVMTSFFIAVLNTLLAVLALAIIIAAKWVLIGKRTPGNYDWDKSSYCQRWQLFLNIERLRRTCYGGHGILGMLTGTHWIVMYFRALGANIGKDCALFVNGRPSLMFTEPDLLTLGDRVVVDDASLVGHINSRGKFDLNELHVGNGAVLRSGSRLLSGAKMGDHSCLLEHTLVMGGDVVESGTTLQGWPADQFSGQRVVR